MKTRIRIFADGSCTVLDGKPSLVFMSIYDGYRYLNGSFFALKTDGISVLTHQGNIPLDK